MAPNLNDPDGLVNLQHLAEEMEKNTASDQTVPIVFVPGFSGWGAPLFGAINYFGGEIDIPSLLVNKGYTVIVASIAPISSNWERACELYRQLTCGQFSKVNLRTNDIEEEYDLSIDYGNYFNPARGPEKTNTTERRRAILYSNSSDFDAWKWGKGHKAHFVCHSQGGNTVRYLISLLANGAGNLHQEYFGEAGRDDWAISVTTLGTPHRGTTIVNVLESLVGRKRQDAVDLVARLFATASFYAPSKRAYDLQLDHWGVRKMDGETFQDMLRRLESAEGPVSRWLNSNNNGLYDNSIEGVRDLSRKTINTSNNVLYFSLSFHATSPFPTDWPVWGKDTLTTFPFKAGIPMLGWATEFAINRFWAFLPSVVEFPAFVKWVTQTLIAKILHFLDYEVVLPNPGQYVPRTDVLPVLLPTVYAMGGQELTQTQKDILRPELEDWFQNDGIVNTASMPGPRGWVKSIEALEDPDFTLPNKRGIYWHLGVNDRMDHADEIGVFIERDTATWMEDMYLDIVKLVSRLPINPPQ